MRLLALALALVTVAIAAPAHGAPNGFTGVDVRVSRLSAGEIVCIRAPCTLPAGRVMVSVFSRGRLVARARTDANGHVRIKLVPGTYAVRTPRLAQENGAGGRRVVVTRNAATDVHLVQRAAPPGNPRE